MHIQLAEIPVTDQERAKAIYTEHLGRETVAKFRDSEGNRIGVSTR